MSQVQLYTKVFVYVNGSLLTQAADVRLTRHSGLMPVSTIVRGFAGFCQGANFIEIEVGNAIPLAGFEYDSGADQANANVVNLTLVVDGQTLSSDGAILSDDISFAVNSESKMNFRFHGEFAQFQ